MTSSWSDTLTSLGEAVNQVEDYRPATEEIMEEETFVKGRSRIKDVESVEKKKIYDVDSFSPDTTVHFLDGGQRTFLCGHIEKRRYGALLPLHFHLSGGVIIDSEWKVTMGPRTQTALIVYKEKFLPKSVRRFLEDAEIRIVESKKRKGTYDYRKLRKYGHETSSHLRDSLEQELIRDFHKDEGYLIKDGTIPEFKDILQRNDIAGLIKTHLARYLKYEDEERVFSMDPGQRSWIFKFERSSIPVYSWYLRIRKIEKDPLSGLIRVEVNPSEEERIDKINSLIMSERFPVEQNTPSWDTKLYPFYVCEQIINSRLPKRDTVYEMLRGTGVIT